MKDLIDLGKQLSAFVVGTEGNISQRTEDGFVITASGKSLKDLDVDAFVYCDVNGDPLPGETGKPSIETSFHAWIYNRSCCKVIAHTHPTNMLKILCTKWTDVFACNRLFPDQVVFNGIGDCVIPYATPGEDLTYAIRYATLRYTKEQGRFPGVLLLENHGIVCCADSIQRAVIMTEICEKAAEVFVGAKALNRVRCLSDKEILDIERHDGEIYRGKMT